MPDPWDDEPDEAYRDDGYDESYARHPARTAYTRRRPPTYVASPPQAEAYDPAEHGRGRASRRAWHVFRKVRRVIIVFAVLLGLFFAFQVASCALGGGRSVADAGSNAVGSSEFKGGSGSSKSGSAVTGKSDGSAAGTGSSVGSSVGSAIGGAVGGLADRFGSLDTSGITNQLSGAGRSLGNAASDLAGAAGSLLLQLSGK